VLEIFYVLFLLSGYLKTLFQFYSVPQPVDFTLLSAVLVLLAGVNKSLRDNFKTSFSKSSVCTGAMLLIFTFWILFKTFDSSSPAYKYEKLVGYGTNLFAYFLPFFFISINIKKILRYFSIGVLLLTIWFLPVYISVMGTERVYEISGLYLGLSFVLGIIFLFFYKKPDLLPGRLVPYNKFILLLIVALMISLGARGPLFFLLIVLVFDFIYKAVNTDKVRIKLKVRLKVLFASLIILFVVSLGGIIYASQSQDTSIFSLIDRSLYRFQLLVEAMTGESSGGTSIEKRTEFISFALKGIVSSPYDFFLGSGFGSFGIDYTGIDKRLYPHNMFLETWYELGLVGMLVLCAFFWNATISRKYSVHQVVSVSLLTYILLNYMKSSSLSDLRIFFAFIAISLVEYYQIDRLNSATSDTMIDKNKTPNNPIE
jgi:hypothetical protein